MTRGRCGLLLLHRDGLAPSTPCRSPGALRYAPNSDHSRHESELTLSANRDRCTAANSISIRSPRRRSQRQAKSNKPVYPEQSSARAETRDRQCAECLLCGHRQGRGLISLDFHSSFTTLESASNFRYLRRPASRLWQNRLVLRPKSTRSSCVRTYRTLAVARCPETGALALV